MIAGLADGTEEAVEERVVVDALPGIVVEEIGDPGLLALYLLESANKEI